MLTCSSQKHNCIFLIILGVVANLANFSLQATNPQPERLYTLFCTNKVFNRSSSIMKIFAIPEEHYQLLKNGSDPDVIKDKSLWQLREEKIFSFSHDDGNCTSYILLEDESQEKTKLPLLDKSPKTSKIINRGGRNCSVYRGEKNYAVRIYQMTPGHAAATIKRDNLEKAYRMGLNNECAVEKLFSYHVLVESEIDLETYSLVTELFPNYSLEKFQKTED